MSDTSPLLSLPLIQPSQAQKHVTHNEGMDRLDMLVQLVVERFDAATPPADPAPGETHALGAAPSGEWAGQGGTLASWRGGGWLFVTPAAGWRAWGREGGAVRVFDGTAWRAPGLGDPDTFGVNAAADAVNRLSVAADATLLSHDGAGHQLKLNKAAPGDTGTLLFQTGFSGRAEMGLAGSDAFALRLSADGTTFRTALTGDAATGGLRLGAHLAFPATPVPSADPHVLDAYAEGAWTPVLSAAGDAPGGAVQTATGQFVKVGRLVLAQFRIALSDPGTGGTGAIRIDGFPYSGGPNLSGDVAHGGFALPGSGVPRLELDGTGGILYSSDGLEVTWSALSGPADLSGQLSYIASQ